MSIAKENLDERIERIKRQTEEIEKKHREAEEDRLMALKMNALVTKSTLDDENWPKAHKYDELDFTYDVDPEKLEESNKAKEEEKLKPKRDYKKFAEGEGPPPDPKYNFLADNERDGNINQQIFHKNDKSKQTSNSSYSNKSKDQFSKRGGSQNNSFRGGRGNNFGSSSKNSLQPQSAPYNQLQNHKLQNKTSQLEQWRNNNDKTVGEDIKAGSNRNQNLKINEKWKKDWDTDKTDKTNFLHESYNSNRSPKHTAIKNIPNHPNQQTNVQQSNNVYSQAEYMIEKRGNITVSVSQTGEVKSVKLSSAPAIGTGRVGPRQLSKTSFQVQTKISPENENFQTQYKQNVNIKTSNVDNPELNNNNTCQNFCGSSNFENKNGSQSINSELQNMEMQNLLHQQKRIKQQQLILQQQQLPQQLLTQHQQNTQIKYGSNNTEVPKLSQNHLLKQSKQELLIQKQREQLQQQQQLQQAEQQQLILQRKKDQQLQLSLLEQQNQQQDQLKQQLLVQQLHQQQQKELMQQRQSLLKQQKHQQQQQQQQQHQQQQQQLKQHHNQQSQSLGTSICESNKQTNEFEMSNAKTLITKSPKKEKKNFKNNFTQKTEMPSKIMNSTVGILQIPEVNNSQNIGAAIIDPKVLDTVAKELSTKPEFAKKSVQDRLLRIRQNSNVENSDGTTGGSDLSSKMNLNSAPELTESETVSCK
ncbi:putative mediator of RNA polymerase II transcription subunit 26 [Condylostylus longicornis]|uniref:putative mediator of RNA polymerase II transcription subunit 26 n=1 Tax=Condylostylus longicornis TaxID=2530218 RepID=UPI00244DD849|nr:putative mediator of RNA polymerase II transcription subunit 26 [Condylostylus longicornis]